MRIALQLEYDGRAFMGWQIQPHGPSVQSALEYAISSIAGSPVRTICAGRTDAGVHALAQVIHFDTEAIRPVNAWVRGVNAHLPDSVCVNWAGVVDQEFHARYSALSRSYRYILLNRSSRPGLDHGKVGWFHQELNLHAMREGAEFLLGEHDFTAFRAAECQAKSPIKCLKNISIQLAGDRLIFDLTANSFLHHMVRNIVGTLIMVGKGRHRPIWVAELLHHRNRSLAAPTFSPAGLYLSAVEYDRRWSIPSPNTYAGTSQ